VVFLWKSFIFFWGDRTCVIHGDGGEKGNQLIGCTWKDNWRLGCAWFAIASQTVFYKKNNFYKIKK
jgi:hypothetical protein